MTPDQRLDQLEPLMAEHSAQLNLHTAQLRRIASGIQLLTDSIHQQSDNITFLLRQQAEMKGDIALIKGGMTEMKSDIEQLKQVQAQQTETLTAILNILQKRSDN